MPDFRVNDCPVFQWVADPSTYFSTYFPHFSTTGLTITSYSRPLYLPLVNRSKVKISLCVFPPFRDVVSRNTYQKTEDAYNQDTPSSAAGSYSALAPR